VIQRYLIIVLVTIFLANALCSVRVGQHSVIIVAVEAYVVQFLVFRRSRFDILFILDQKEQF